LKKLIKKKKLNHKGKNKNKEKNQQKMHGSPICNIAKFWHPNKKYLMLYKKICWPCGWASSPFMKEVKSLNQHRHILRRFK
jgi:hypothetical protein